LNEQIAYVLKEYQDFVISTDKEEVKEDEEKLKEIRDFPCLGMVSFRFFHLDKAKDSILKEPSPSSADALLITSDCIVLLEFKNPWSEHVEKLLSKLISEFLSKRDFALLNSTFIRKELQNNKNKLREAIITTINEKFKLEEKLHGSCHILAKICERHSLKVPFKIEFIVLVDVTEDFVNRIRDESKNHSLLRLRKLGDKNSSLQFIEKNFCTIVGFVKDMLKGILNDRCENFSESLSALITDCKCLDCGEFKLFLAGNESNILFP